MIGALLRKFWPGYYTPVPGGERKLATTWEGFKLGEAPGFESAADAVTTKFWVSNISRVLFIVDDPTLTIFLCMIEAPLSGTGGG